MGEKNGNEQLELEPSFKFSVVEEQGDEVIIEVSEEDYRREIKAGILAEETFKPGRYKMRRGEFQKRHPAFDASRAKTKIGIYVQLDADLIEHLETLRSQSKDETLEQIINDELRKTLRKKPLTPTAKNLLDDTSFISALKEKLREAV